MDNFEDKHYVRKISILGSTGSIGTQTLDVVRNNGDIKVVGISAGKNVKLLEKQIREFHPKYVSVADEATLSELKAATKDLNLEYGVGMEGLITCATLEEIDTVVTAVVGMMGITPTIEAIKAHKDIALANKETLVTAGHIIIQLAKENGVAILPVDSEHSAIFQSLNGERNNKINKILLTASGGPFRGWTKDRMKNIQVEDALKHPNWSMGRKITIDSSTMVNKGLEVMEAKWLFGVDIDDVQVVVQPQSIIHSMVEFKDGAVIAQLGTPDMRLPIQYALYYPQRRVLPGEKLDFWKLSQITFEKPDMENFAGLAMAYEVGRKGGNMPTLYNAANEKAVAMFLDKKIGYLDILDIIRQTIDNIEYIENPSVAQILESEAAAYEFINSKWMK